MRGARDCALAAACTLRNVLLGCSCRHRLPLQIIKRVNVALDLLLLDSRCLLLVQLSSCTRHDMLESVRHLRLWPPLAGLQLVPHRHGVLSLVNLVMQLLVYLLFVLQASLQLAGKVHRGTCVLSPLRLVDFLRHQLIGATDEVSLAYSEGVGLVIFLNKGRFPQLGRKKGVIRAVHLDVIVAEDAEHIAHGHGLVVHVSHLCVLAQPPSVICALKVLPELEVKVL